MGKLALILICLVGLGCGFLKNDRSGQNTNSAPARNEAADAERLKKFYEINDKRAELGKAPAKLQLSPEPYLKGKVLFLHTRSSQPPTVANVVPVQDKYSPPPGPMDSDVLKDVMATNLDEIGTIVLMEDELYEDGCKEVDKSLYKSGDGKYVIGSAQICEVTIIDRSIPAVVFKKKFEGKLQERESFRTDKGYVLAKVERKEIYDFLAGLPRR
jgi:hypothetical protein